MSYNLGLMSKVEAAIATGSASRRSEMLRHVTDLFIIGAEQFSGSELALFDDVLARLMVDIERSARALLSVRLAPIRNAPPKTIRNLAFDDVIDVAGPVLAQSEQLDDPMLVENARSKGQEHLLAISRRRSLSEAVTDVLVERGDDEVVFSAVENQGAKFSDRSFASLVERSQDNDRLAARVGARREIPARLLLKLLQTASQAVRHKLEAAHPHAKAEVRQVVAEATSRVREETLAGSPDYVAARARVEALHRSAGLDERALAHVAAANQFVETAMILARLCDLPVQFIERSLSHERSETVLILARAIGLTWPTVKAILTLRGGKRGASPTELAQSMASFERLRQATAREIVRFYRLREQPAANKQKV